MKVKVFNKSNLQLPKYETEEAAALDLLANAFDGTFDELGMSVINQEEDDWTIILQPNKRVLIKTGLHVQVPSGYKLEVLPRSGNALKAGITVLNSPGTVDADYRGEVGVILVNTSKKPFTIKKGDRIAQADLVKVETIEWDSVDSLEELEKTERGEKGFGSSGK